MISRNMIFLCESLNLILENKSVIILSKNVYTKLSRKDDMETIIRPKDYKICFTVNYVSKNINYVPDLAPCPRSAHPA